MIARVAVGVAVSVLFAVAPLTAQKQKKHYKDFGDATYPAHVLIIRHAEKPPDSANSADLSPAGVSRAKALAGLFTASPTRRDPLPRPDFIFATRVSKNSHRPLETASALGTALGLEVNSKFRDEATEALAQELFSHAKYAGKTVLIVWHQGTIPKLAKALGAKDAPHGWKDSVFDRVWEISYDQNGGVTFQDRPQYLLGGDSVR